MEKGGSKDFWANEVCSGLATPEWPFLWRLVVNCRPLAVNPLR